MSTGKTTRLLTIIEEEISSGTLPERIAFCSFTKKSVLEAKTRACNKFGFSAKQLPYFQTIHALAFHATNAKRIEIISPVDFEIIGDHLGIEFSKKFDIDSGIYSMTKTGDKYASLMSLSRAKCKPPEEQWENMSLDNLNWYEFDRFKQVYTQYKLDRGLIDFNDLLERCSIELPVDVVIIDEAQDLSTLQWKFIEKVFSNVKRRYVAGDDDQSIYSWSGADTEYFQNLIGKKEVLHQSYRIPKTVHNLAESISSKIQHRTKKDYLAKNTEGNVEYWRSLQGIDMSNGSWLLLARNGYLLPQLVKFTQTEGFNYTIKGEQGINSTHIKAIRLWEAQRKHEALTPKQWLFLEDFTDGKDKTIIWHEAFTKLSIEKRELYISLLRRGESLERPRIHINTIHGVKGGEADNVILLTDCSFTTWDAMSIDADSEHRVWYVGVTRTKENLHIIGAQGRYSYDL